nr:hypothetical protein [Tanacetum cinerariifolium]
MELEEEDGDDEKYEDDSIEYLTSGGDNDADDDGDNLSEDDADDEDEEVSSDRPFEEGETAATPPPFGYRIAARISVQPHILMPFCLESESIPEADIPLWKRAHFTTPIGGYKVGESSVAAAARQIRPTLTIADRRRADDRLIDRLRKERRYFRTLRRADDRLIDRLRRERRYFRTLSTTYAQEKMAPKRTTRSTQVPPDTPAPTTTTTTITEAQLQALINQGVAATMAE